jgi:RNase H-fold protein (predicted Holliday junction resolvase)
MNDLNPKTLAIDWGRKRIGLAIGQSEWAIRSLGILKNNPEAFDRIKNLITEEQVEKIIIGSNINPEIKIKIQNLGLPLATVDEDFSSVAAQSAKKTSQDRPVYIDHLAAVILLEQYFAQQERKARR